MRAVCDLYEHPELSDSEVWAKDAYNRSGTTRMLATVGVFWIGVLSTVAALEFMGYVDVRGLRTGRWLRTGL